MKEQQPKYALHKATGQNRSTGSSHGAGPVLSEIKPHCTSLVVGSATCLVGPGAVRSRRCASQSGPDLEGSPIVDSGCLCFRGTRGTSVRDPNPLLTAWAGEYQGPLSKRTYFAIGEADDIERVLFEWCRRNGVTVTLSGFSAAWKSAPMVRVPIVTAYVDRSLSSLTKQLTDENDIAQVESGANLILWEPYDTSVFADRRFSGDALISWTSPIQTYLDLIQLIGTRSGGC